MEFKKMGAMAGSSVMMGLTIATPILDMPYVMIFGFLFGSAGIMCLYFEYVMWTNRKIGGI